MFIEVCKYLRLSYEHEIRSILEKALKIFVSTISHVGALNLKPSSNFRLVFSVCFQCLKLFKNLKAPPPYKVGISVTKRKRKIENYDKNGAFKVKN